MSTWATARAALATKLAAVTATVGATVHTIKTVHQFPIAAIAPGDTPCFVMALPEVAEPPVRGSGHRTTVYLANCGLFVADAKVEQAAEILDGFIHAVIAEFDSGRGLGGDADYVAGPRVLPANPELFAGVRIPHVTFQFEVQVGADVTITA